VAVTLIYLQWTTEHRLLLRCTVCSRRPCSQPEVVVIHRLWLYFRVAPLSALLMCPLGLGLVTVPLPCTDLDIAFKALKAAAVQLMPLARRTFQVSGHADAVMQEVVVTHGQG
jgi:hypothetical protein